MFEDIIKPKQKSRLPLTSHARWYPRGCVEVNEYGNGICWLCDKTKKCKCYHCLVQGIECERCVDG